MQLFDQILSCSTRLYINQDQEDKNRLLSQWSSALTVLPWQDQRAQLLKRPVSDGLPNRARIMKIDTLINQWEQEASARLTSQEYCVRLPLEDAARITALVEMYPRRSQDEIIRELLTAALDELESSFPYVQGSQVVGEDELGDPLYEDVGPTPKFLELSKKHMELLKEESRIDKH